MIIRDEETRLEALGMVMKAPLYAEVIIEEKPKGKSAQQRKYFHKLVQLIVEHMDGFTDKYNMEAMKRNITEKCDLMMDRTTLDGEIKTEPMRTEHMDVEQYNTIIEAAQIICDMLEIKIPAPSYYGYG